MENKELRQAVRVAVFETMIKKATYGDGGLDVDALLGGVADALGTFMVQMAEQSEDKAEDLTAEFNQRLLEATREE